jgi:hypothetical protein
MLFPVHNPRKKKNQPEHSGCNSLPQVSKLLSCKVSGDAKDITTKPVLKYKTNKEVERQKMEESGYTRHSQPSKPYKIGTSKSNRQNSQRGYVKHLIFLPPLA